MSAKRKFEDCSDRNEGPPGSTKKDARFHWSNGLSIAIDNPSEHVFSDKLVVAIKDKYPKAKHHFLVLPRKRLHSLSVLTNEDVPLLKHMGKVGETLSEREPSSVFRIGYHALPSMSHLHLHVISEDFDSPCLKTKKHWNSFSTDYFKSSKDVIEQLSKYGRVVYDAQVHQAMLKQPLRCHKCDLELKTIPKLKEHLKNH